MPQKRARSIDRIIHDTRRASVLRELPHVLIPVWQIKLRERFGINVDREIAAYVVLAAHESGTWKKHRAIKRIEHLMISRGETPLKSRELAQEIIKMATGTVEV
ncbi:MAG: hypothetical protein M1148_01955 [Candidatus Thermoplasmatota archaeon]|nr:hypothetical protein [Candidatus Thermoplasmatota archaeon]